MPDWSRPESREFDVVAVYGRSDVPRTVRLPTSTSERTILSLRAKPADLVQTWRTGDRLLMLPAKRADIRVHCRYRLFREPAADGQPRPWPSPTELFPGADSIREANQR